MKKKFLALLVAVLMLPVFSAFAAQVGWADSEMEGIYAVLGGEDAMTIRSRVSLGGKGGYCQALYAVELTGKETKAELDAAAVRLVKSGAKPVWGGSKHCYHGGSYTAQPEYTISASSVQPGSYLYVCYAFGCESGDNYNHVPVPCFDRISTMSVRITPKSQAMELSFVLEDGQGKELGILPNGGAAQIQMGQGDVKLRLRSAVAYPNEEIISVRADFPDEQVADAFHFNGETGILTPVSCGSGTITVTIRAYLTGQTREECISVTVPCAPQAEPTVITPSTCTEEGLAVYRCYGYGSNCETSFEQVALPAEGHALYSVSQYVQKPTATQPGIGMGTCKKCGMIGVEQAVGPIFSDVAGSAFYSVPLDYCYDEGWVSGVTAKTFEPGSNCVRAQVVTFLWRAAGCPKSVSSGNPFVDVQKGSYYYDAVLWAAEQGITNGTDATHFSPKGTCSRAQVVTFLWRAFGQPQTQSQECPFRDVRAGSWYEQSVIWALEQGITSGMTADSFSPDSSCSRAQIVTFLYRAYAE